MMTRYSEKTISGAYVMTMRLTIWALVRLGLKLGMEEELRDLKGLITLGEITNLDVDLLSTLKDPMVKLVVETIYLIHGELEAFKLIHNVNEDKLGYDGAVGDFAWDFFISFVQPIEKSRQHLNEICKLHFMSMHLCYEFAILAEHRAYDLEGDYFENFLYRYYAADFLSLEKLLEELNLQNRHSVGTGRLLIALEVQYYNACALAEAGTAKKRKR